jgi:hypothetical protein
MNSKAEADTTLPDPKQWLIDVNADYVLHKPTGLGFHIDFLPAEFASGVIGVRGFVAVPVPIRTSHDKPSGELIQRARQAVDLYVALLRMRLQRDNSQSGSLDPMP